MVTHISRGIVETIGVLTAGYHAGVICLALPRLRAVFGYKAVDAFPLHRATPCFAVRLGAIAVFDALPADARVGVAHPLVRSLCTIAIDQALGAGPVDAFSVVVALPSSRALLVALVVLAAFIGPTFAGLGRCALDALALEANRRIILAICVTCAGNAAEELVTVETRLTTRTLDEVALRKRWNVVVAAREEKHHPNEVLQRLPP